MALQLKLSRCHRATSFTPSIHCSCSSEEVGVRVCVFCLKCPSKISAASSGMFVSALSTFPKSTTNKGLIGNTGSRLHKQIFSCQTRDLFQPVPSPRGAPRFPSGNARYGITAMVLIKCQWAQEVQQGLHTQIPETEA